jgi:histidinol-phosphatase (PHP family)
MRVDLHNHTTLCNHATGTSEEYIKKAIDLGIDVYGFSDHAPMKFDTEYRMSLEQSDLYKKEILYLKEKYKKDIDILLAYEVDYMSNSSYLEDVIINAKVDYLIGSVHFIDEWGFDNPAYLKDYAHKDIDKLWQDYFDTIEYMAKTNYFDVAGHLDLIKVFNYLPKKDIRIIAKNALMAIKKSDMTIEINTAGLRKPIKEQYPSMNLLKMAFELGIDITFSSDAHSVKQVGLYYEEVAQIAKSIGYTDCIIFKNKEKVRVKF